MQVKSGDSIGSDFNVRPPLWNVGVLFHRMSVFYFKQNGGFRTFSAIANNPGGEGGSRHSINLDFRIFAASPLVGS